MPVRPKERHRIGRIGRLRAAVLGANDCILSTASLALGFAAAGASHNNIRLAKPEEQDVRSEFGKQWDDSAAQTPNILMSRDSALSRVI